MYYLLYLIIFIDFFSYFSNIVTALILQLDFCNHRNRVTLVLYVAILYYCSDIYNIIDTPE